MQDNEALVLAYVRFIQEDNLVEEMLFARPLLTDSKCESIFKILDNFFKKKEIPFCIKYYCVCHRWGSCYGRPTSWIYCILKNAVPNVFAVHCVVHREHLVAKHLSHRLHNSLHIVITAVNKIKSSALKDRYLANSAILTKWNSNVCFYTPK